MLQQITPLILTCNEAPNIARTLAQLAWATAVVVVDSYSQDDTCEIASSFSNVRIVQRNFDSHESQWNFALKDTAISSDWVLALDADYFLTPESIAEIRNLTPEPEVNGYWASFNYCLNGRPLRSGVYPEAVVLYRRELGHYVQDGHTQRLQLPGKISRLGKKILHDDRKPLQRWFQSQLHYSSLEADKLWGSDPINLSFADRVRRWRLIAPLAICFYCLIIRGGVLDGWAGFYYAFQRTLAELLLSLQLIERDFHTRAVSTALSGRIGYLRTNGASPDKVINQSEN
jgi:glycosyltransferase involved in cell wall biosynthesis